MDFHVFFQMFNINLYNAHKPDLIDRKHCAAYSRQYNLPDVATSNICLHVARCRQIVFGTICLQRIGKLIRYNMAQLLRW